MSSSSKSDGGDATVKVFDYNLHIRLIDPPMSLDERREGQIEAHRLIREKYDAGVPLFTKNLLRDIARQLEDSSSKAVSITGLDGVTIQYPLKAIDDIRRRHYYHGPGYYTLWTKPQLSYRRIEDLLRPCDPDWYVFKRAYLPVEIYYATETRNVHTNELMNHFAPISDYATINRLFRRTKQSLQGNEHFARFKAVLASAPLPAGINKIVAFACSTMARGEGNYPTDGSMTQHTLALTIRDFLAERDAKGTPGESRAEIKCFAQDPAYAPVDKQVLHEHGITVVDDPGGFLEVDEASVVISAFPDIPVRQIVADIARPALIIWNDLKKRDETIRWTDPTSSRVSQMLEEEYIELPFPLNDEYFHSGVAMYVRKGN